MKHLFRLGFAIFVCVPMVGSAQQQIIAPARSISWQLAGVPGGIPNRTTICSTLNPGVTAAAIDAAITACPAGQVVFLNAGTYNLETGIRFSNKSYVTLRGAGPDKTFLTFPQGGDPCGGLGGNICFINGDANSSEQPRNIADWTAGYEPRTTSITLSNTTGLQVGSLLVLDQLDDSDTDTGEIWSCQKEAVCSQQGGVSQGRPGRGQTQVVHVSTISSGPCPCAVGFSPGLYMPNWRAGQSPGAWWGNSLPITLSGVEDLSIDNSASDANGGVFIFNGYGIWVKNIRSLYAHQKHVWMYQSVHTTVRDSYFYGTQAAASDSYATDTFTGGDQLVENNIFQHIASPMLNEGAQGTVHAYNFAVDDYFTAGETTNDWQQASSYQHAIGNAFILWEGNVGIAMTSDDIHGSSHFITAFRNYWHGQDLLGGSPAGGKQSSTNAIQLEAYNRYYNIIGNVLGKPAYFTNYEAFPSSPTDPGSETLANHSIYNFGFSANEGTLGGFPNDTVLRSTLYRWGNYDSVTAGVRWENGEVPQSLPKYAQAPPGDHTLPASLYLTAGPPSRWSNAFGTVPWPAIGPDVTTGNIIDTAGHANKIPAQLCFEHTASVNGILSFNANSCYNSGPVVPVPSAPQNLRIIR